jgi:hypothetical protein
MKLKHYGLGAFALVAAFSIGRFSAPKSIQTKDSVRTDSQTNTITDKNSNTVEVVKETRLPDGTVIKETRKEKETSIQTERQRVASTVRESSSTTEVRPSFRVGGVYQPAIKGFQENGYGLILEKRLFSEVYLGILVESDKTAALTISFGF